MLLEFARRLWRPRAVFFAIILGSSIPLASMEGADDAEQAAALDKRVASLYGAGKFQEAIPFAERSISLHEKINGPEHPDTASSINRLGLLYHESGDHAKAEPLYRRALAIREKALGPGHPDTATSLDNLASLYYSVGDYAKAEPLYRRALAITEKAVGSDHTDTATSLNNLAELYRATGDYAKAEPLLQRALTINEKALGPEHPQTASGINNLALLYEDIGNYTKAESLSEHALAIWEKTLGPRHPQVATGLNNLAGIFARKGDYTKAEPLYQRALAIWEKAAGPQHRDTATSLINLASLYKTMGEYAKAEPLLQRALTINEKALGPEHADTATALQRVAILYDALGDYARAEPLLQRALAITEKALGPEHPDTARDVNNLAIHYQEKGDYARAEPLLRRGLAIDEKALGPEHPQTASAINNLAELYMGMGDYAKAGPLYQRALAIWEKAFGPQHSNTAIGLNNLAGLYLVMRDYGRTESLFKRSLAINEKVLGPDHPETAKSINNLASLYYKMGEYPRAHPFHRRALAISEKGRGPQHPMTARYINNLATTYRAMGDYVEAESLYRRAIAILEKALGPQHPATADSVTDLALVNIGLGTRRDPALALATRAGVAREIRLGNILSFTSEQQRLAFQKTTHPFTLLATLGSAPPLAQAILRNKGVVLDSLLEDRLIAEASRDAKQHEAIEEVRAMKQRFTQLLLGVPKDFSEAAHKRREAEKETLSRRIEELESALGRQVAGLGKARRALSLTTNQVQAALSKDQVLIELIRYDHYLGKNNFESRYGAVAISPTGEPTWACLGRAEEIEAAIALYRSSARGRTDEETLQRVLRALQAQVWAPMENILPEGTKQVILSPDGQLNFVSFATLLGPDDKFLAEKYAVSYVASGRDLLRETKASSNQAAFVYANPDFAGQTVALNGAASSSVALRVTEMRDLENISLPPLPGTAAEAAALEKRRGKSVKAFLGANATETELRRVNSPHVLHLATHGFFLPEIELGKETNPLKPADDIPKGKLINPMHRSGLALAGAERTLKAWARGEVPPTESDGIVTAEEVGGLNLNGTWLVVLSACDTGLGEARAGEGVLGLRRGFIEAGAQNLLMTLWPISDETTVQIMLDFYDAADKSKNAPQALADVQRDWLMKLRKERGLLEAVRLAGPFIMSSQGRN